MLNPVQLDGEPTLVTIQRPEIKLSSTPKIAIAIPCGDKEDHTLLECPTKVGGCGKSYLVPGKRHPLLVPVRFMVERDNIIKPLNVTTATLFDAGRLSAEARQIMTKKALRMGSKYILYWDDDILPPPHGLYILHNFLEQHPEIGAVSGVCTTREDPPEPVVYKEHGQGAWWDFPMGHGAEPQPIFAAGAGFIMARLSAIEDVIERMKEENGGEEVPIWADERALPYSSEEIGSRLHVVFGHDVRFCRLLNKYGHPVYVHGAVLCRHLDVASNRTFGMPGSEPDIPASIPVDDPEKKEKPSVEVLIVKYNQPELEARTFRAACQHTEYPNFTIKAYQNKPGVSLAKCWNDLIRESKADYICLLNPDTVPARGWLEKLMGEVDEDTGALVPSSNIVHMSQIATTLDRFEESFGKINEFALSLDGGVEELPTVSAMCVVFPREVWERLGGFDEEFQLYGEDTEFFWRVRNNLKKKLKWVRGAYVHHYKAQCVEKAVEEEGLDIEKLRREAAEMCTQKTDMRF